MSLGAWIGDMAFAIALLAPLPAVLLLGLSLRRSGRTRRRVMTCAAIVLATLVAHPLAQLPLLEPFDQQRGEVLAAKADEAQLVGMTEEQVRELLGSPSSVHQLESGQTIWAYKQLPGYWLGSSFQVFVRDQSVTGFEANDD